MWKYHRRSIRLKGYDYSRPGAYFVTICLYGREPYLQMPAVRTIVEEVWNALPQRFSTIALDEFLVMPDHVHFILWLRPDAENRPTLGRIVCAYKSLIGRAALSYLRTLGDICGNHFWQRDYYDHIISSATRRNYKKSETIFAIILTNKTAVMYPRDTRAAQTPVPKSKRMDLGLANCRGGGRGDDGWGRLRRPRSPISASRPTTGNG